jgi:uncharacterized protein (TIGR02001 family)
MDRTGAAKKMGNTMAKTFVYGAVAALITAAGATGALAQNLSVSGGLALTSDYVSSGISQTGGDHALQAYVEMETAAGIYAGIWGSNVDFGDADKVEIDLYFGYRNELASGISYDLGYARYFYDDSGNCCGEIILSMGVPLGNVASLTPYIALDPENEGLNTSVAVDVAVNDQIGLMAKIGKVKDGQEYYQLGGSYALTDATAMDLSWHDTDIDDGTLVFTLSYDFSIFGR